MPGQPLPDDSTDALLRQLASSEPGARPALLGSASDGLTSAEARCRLLSAGPNTVAGEDRRSPLAGLAAQFTHTLALLLWFAGALAFAAGIYELAGAILAVILVNGAFAFAQEYRASRVVEGLMRRVSVRARVFRDGVEVSMPATDLVPGDVIELQAGDITPADAALLEADGLSVDLSVLTGESLPVEREPQAFAPPVGRPRLEALPPMLPAGCGVVTGRARAVVFATGPRSTIGRISALTGGLRVQTSILERQVATLSRVTAIIAVLVGAGTLALSSATGEQPFAAALTFSTGVIVALVPEGLLPTLSVSLAIGARRMASRGVAVRRLSAIEVIGSATVICTDKTGTLTENTLTVRGLVPVPGRERDATLAAVLCNDATDGGQAGDPLDVALWRWAEAAGHDPATEQEHYPRQHTVPFDARARFMSVTCLVEGVPTVFLKGAPEAILGETGTRAPEAIERAMTDATEEGDRVLLLASGPEAEQPAIAGLVRFQDPPRAGVREAIAACRRAGIRVVMLTGDHPQTAMAVARAIGLDVGGLPLATGAELDGMSDETVEAFLAGSAIVARVDPEQKLRIVRVLEAAGEVVVVTGDGINDAPALRAADVGVAMGRRGTEVAKQAADVILADDNFTTIVVAIEEGRSIRANIRRFVSYVFTSNVAELAPFLVFIFLPVPLALVVIQALAIDIGTDLLPALALGAEAPARGTMRARPEEPSSPLLGRRLALLTFLFFGALEAALGLAAFFAFYAWSGWSPGEAFAADLEGEARTLTFLAIVGGQVGCLFAQRDGGLLARLDIRHNRWAVAGLVGEIVLSLALVYVPGLNGLFQMESVAPTALLALPAAAVAFTAADVLRRSARRPRTPLSRNVGRGDGGEGATVAGPGPASR